MAQFEPGKVLKTNFGAPIKILEYLDGGGQGDVYVVEYGGQKKALKWYKDVGKNPDAFYDNLRHNVDKGSPDKAFLWPEAVTEKTEGSFGYIMNLRPEGYYDLSNIMLARKVKKDKKTGKRTVIKVQFASFKTAVDACLNVVTAFRHLHNNGYSYQDLNDGNFFINPQTGDVLICDNDNVAPDGINMGVLGTMRYMAPEIVSKNILPSIKTDRYSLAVILFIILMMGHPLEGAKSMVPCITEDAEKNLYGKEALFIFDPDNNANCAVEKISPYAIQRWNIVPCYIRDMFLKAFSQQAIKEPNRRVIELEWLKVLVRFRSDIAKCECGDEVFINNAATTKCDRCGRPQVINHTIQLPEYSITAIRGTRIYRCQLGMCNADDALNPVALVVSKDNDPNVLGLKNMTNNILSALTPSGIARQVKPQEVVPFIAGIVLEAYGKKIIFK